MQAMESAAIGIAVDEQQHEELRDDLGDDFGHVCHRESGLAARYFRSLGTLANPTTTGELGCQSCFECRVILGETSEPSPFDFANEGAGRGQHFAHAEATLDFMRHFWRIY